MAEVRQRKPVDGDAADEPEVVDTQPQPSAPRKTRELKPPEEPLYQKVVLLLILLSFVGASYKILVDPQSVLWLEEYLDFWSAPARPSSPDMLTLTADNFDEAKDSTDGYLVEFYAPWCGACKAFSSEMSKTATALKGITPVGAIDGTEHRELMSAHGSRGYPSILLFKGGERTEYTGARKSATLVKWVRRRTQGLESVTSFADLLDAGPTPLADSGTTVIAVLPAGGASTELGDVFLQAALDDDSREYITCMNDADVTAMCGGEDACVVLQTPLRPQTLPITWGWKVEPRHATSGNPALAALQEFVGVEEFPEVVEFTTAHARVVLGAWHNRTAWLFAPVDSAIATSFRALAAQHRSDALFIVVENDDNLKKIVGLADLPAPAFGLTRRKPSSPSKLWVYPLEAELVEGGGGAAIAAHFAAVMGGLAPKLKSAEPPADNTAPVKVVVGSTFDSFRSKDLFLKVYAPWCGHCKKMAPIWTELATAYAGDDTLTIGKMDGTDNEADSVEVKGYPTLLFFPSGRADFVPYNGKRNVEAFTEFIESVRAKQADDGGGAQESNEPVA